jgi:metaxin
VVISAETLYKDAEEAFMALETVLGEDEWFFGAAKPSLFDASVFAYTNLLLDDGLGNGWSESRLRNTVLGKQKLVALRERILATYYAGA